MLEHIASAAAYGMVLADLANPKACLPPGFSSPVSTALGWVSRPSASSSRSSR